MTTTYRGDAVRWYNRKGERISVEEADKLLTDREERRVALTEVCGFQVSTVFLVLDHAMMGGPPMLYETMVFAPSRDMTDRLGEELAQRRYSTEEEALKGHAEYVDELRRRVAEWAN